MKKIMFMLAFVGVGLFASASNGKVEKIKLPIKKEAVVIKKETKFKQWQVTYTCPGFTIVVCCFNTYSGAVDYMMDHDYYCN